jgi:NADPH-dependent curcumin reductase CurA
VSSMEPGSTEAPIRSREVRAATRPQGALSVDNFEVCTVTVPPLGDGEVLVRNEFMALSAIMGNLMGAGPRSRMPMPLFALGEPLSGVAVGTVVQSTDAAFSSGDLVQHRLGWREYAWGPAAGFRRLDRGVLPAPQYFLSQGPTAWRGMVDMANVGAGDVVFVSGAAGGVGSLAGQIARCRGAKRVIGSAGSQDKVDFLVQELHYDAAFDYHGPIQERLRALAPEGLDVVFDNVGGEQFEAALQVARPGARFALCGVLSSQVTTNPEADMFLRVDQVTAGMKEVVLRPFATRPTAEWVPHFAKWLDEGRMIFPHTIVQGLDNAPAALVSLLGGQYKGSVIVQLGARP